jgi:hypothetical protein
MTTLMNWTIPLSKTESYKYLNEDSLIPRVARDTLNRISSAFPIVAITGPRQSGKTTLARSTFSDKPYRTLEDPEHGSLPAAIPVTFWLSFPTVLCSTKYNVCRICCPTCKVSWMRGRRMGLFVITGSQQFQACCKRSRNSWWAGRST